MTSTELMNTAAFANMVPDAAFSTLNPADESLADGIGSSYGIIGYKGKVWTLRLRGETYTFTRPDDGSPAAFLDVIVLRSAPYKSKSYYAGGYVEGSSEAPTCSSLDGITPAPDARDKQCAACAICPRNEWKEKAEGRKGRDCADFKRLAVLLLPNISKQLLGSPLMEPVFLRVPAASLNDLAILGEAMQKKGFHYSSYITRIGFHMDKPHPQMTFKALQPLTAKEAPIVLPMREDPQAIRITGENEVGKSAPATQQLQPVGPNGGTSAGATTQTRSTATPASTNQQQTKTSPSETKVTKPAEDDEEAALMKQLEAARAKKAAAAQVAKQEVLPPVKKPEPSNVDTGFGDLGETQPMVEVGSEGSDRTAPAVAQTTAGNQEDTGPAEDADADLDAAVAALLQR